MEVGSIRHFLLTILHNTAVTLFLVFLPRRLWVGVVLGRPWRGTDRSRDPDRMPDVSRFNSERLRNRLLALRYTRHYVMKSHEEGSRGPTFILLW